MVCTLSARARARARAVGLALALLFLGFARTGLAADIDVQADPAIVDASDLANALRAEVEADVVVRVVPEGDGARIEVVRGVEVRARVISLLDVPKERHARVLALAAADLLRDMPKRAPAAPVVLSPTPTNPTAAQPPSPPLRPPGPSPEGQLGAFLRYQPGTDKAYVGAVGKMTLCWGIVCPRAEIQLGVSNTDTSLGSVTATLFRAGGGIDLALRPQPWLMITTGPSVLVGTFGASAKPLSGARADSFTAASLDAKWSGLAAFRAGYLMWIYGELGVGATAFGGSAFVGTREQVSDRGVFVEGSVGLRFAADREPSRMLKNAESSRLRVFSNQY